MKRDKRDDFDVITNFEIISVYDNRFFDVAFDVTNEIIVIANDVINNVINASKTNNFIDIVENEKNEIDDIDVKNVANVAKKLKFSIIKNEKNFFDFLQCLIRT